MTAVEQDPGATDPERRPILDLSADEANSLLLQQESYCRLDLPPYFQFEPLLTRVDAELRGTDLSSLTENPRTHDHVNHVILDNKDGRHAWRRTELIHPALYVSLVKCLTQDNAWQAIRARFAQFAGRSRIRCLSLPVQSLTEEKNKAAQVSHWWREIEQRSIELALDYEYLVHTDVTDCYGAIYTHSISWALHGKDEAKKCRQSSNLLGNTIDRHIQDMHHGQTNGIPQGSVLMDLIAEMVLGYADLELAQIIERNGVSDYFILRYRDDYRVFVNNPEEGERILKAITEVMMGLGLKLNTAKTGTSGHVIRESIKADKLAWMNRTQGRRNLQKHLLIIHSHAMDFPNAGSVIVALGDYNKRLSRAQSIPTPLPLISIVTDIAFRNPRAYPICAAVLSRLLRSLESDELRKEIVGSIVRRFARIPNTGYLELWIQRISRGFDPEREFDEPLCRLAQGGGNSLIWNSNWITSKDLRSCIEVPSVFDDATAEGLDPVIPQEEASLFLLGGDRYL